MDDFIRPNNKSFVPGTKPGGDAKVPAMPMPETNLASEKETVELEAPQNPQAPIEQPNSPKGFKKFLKKFTRKQKIIFLIILLILGAGGIFAYFYFFNTSAPISTVAKKVVPTPTKKPEEITSPLTGVILKDANLAKRPVTGIMIENSPDARPQSGLNEAGIVYEAVAEGGITRFLALFQESTPQYIGPVRSARAYYVNFDLSFDASYAHVGGSPEAMEDIKSLGVKDLDQFYNPQGYWRISERYAPHNVYTSFEKLDALNNSKGYTSSKFTSLKRKKDVPQTPTANVIDLSMSGFLYNPNFVYDQATNSYKRSQGGSAHTDEKSGAQLNPKVVIAMVMEKGLMDDGSHTSYKDIGSGKVYVFQDGIVSEGTWSKTDKKSPIVLTDKYGLDLKLNAGQTWFTAVGSSSDVAYRPQ